LAGVLVVALVAESRLERAIRGVLPLLKGGEVTTDRTDAG
jgi:hypothetical protein